MSRDRAITPRKIAVSRKLELRSLRWLLVGVAVIFTLVAGGVALVPGRHIEASTPPTQYRTSISTRYPIKHVVIIDKENHSFDNMFGQFPGADGVRWAVTSRGRHIHMIRTPDHTLLDVSHAGAAAILAMNNGRMNQFDQFDQFDQMDQKGSAA